MGDQYFLDGSAVEIEEHMSKEGKSSELASGSEGAEPIDQQADRLGLDKQDLIEMYRKMCLIRRFERMADQLYAAGKVHGTMHLSAGQEAAAIGAGTAVQPDDYLLNHHRGHGHFIAKGADIDRMMAEFLGKESGYCRGRGGSMHIADFDAHNLGANGIVGGGLSLAVGVGLAVQMQKLPHIVLCTFGDGAVNQGIFHESLNMAALWDLPIIFLCENNQYGMSMAVSRATSRLPISDRAEVYGMKGYHVDGNDLLSVYQTTLAAADQARSGGGPVLIEAVTYRYFGHSKSDRNLYRTKEEIDTWRAKDPIKRFRRRLVSAEILTEAEAEEIDEGSQLIIDEAVAFAEDAPEPDVSALTEYVYA